MTALGNGKLGTAALALLYMLSSNALAADDALSKPELEVRQAWLVKSTGPTTTRVIIGRIESVNDKVVVHVSLLDIPSPTDVPVTTPTFSIGHMPFEKTALVASLDKLIATDAVPAPAFESGYENWRSNKGGVFTVSVPDAITFAVEAMKRATAK